MKIGIGSYAFRWYVGNNGSIPEQSLDVINFLRISSQLEAEAVQICDNLPLDSIPDHGLQDIKLLSEDLNLEIEIGVRGCNLEYLVRQLAICKKLNAKILRVVLSESEWSPSPNEVERLIHNLIPALRAHDVRLAIENHFGLLPEELADLMDRIDDDQVGICLDPFNSIYRLVHPNTTIQLLAPFAISVHVKDVSVSRFQTGFYVAGCPLGTGQLDLEFLLDQLEASGHSPNLFVENWLDRTESLAETIKQEEEWVLQGLKVLQEKKLLVGGRHR